MRSVSAVEPVLRSPALPVELEVRRVANSHKRTPITDRSESRELRQVANFGRRETQDVGVHRREDSCPSGRTEMFENEV